VKRLNCFLELVDSQLHLQIFHFEQDRHDYLEDLFGNCINADFVSRNFSVLVTIKLAKQPSHPSCMHVPEDHFGVAVHM
jgi:hypothetical protein